MLVRHVVRVALLAVCSAAVCAQQTWVPLHTRGNVGTGATVAVAQSPLPPTVLAPLPAPLFAASTLQSYRAGTWRRRADVLPPELGTAQAAVYDPAGQRLVAYSTHLGVSTVCVFDGARWTVLPTVNAPPARVGPALAYDVLTGKVVMFGGAVPGSFGVPFADTWTLDGSTWTQVGVAGPQSPPARKNARLVPALIPGGFGLLMFGGNGQFGGAFHFDDTWAFDGTAWTQLSPASHPSAREGAAMAFDAASGTTVLYGGNGIVGITVVPLADAWTWDGTDWTQVAPPAVEALVAPQLVRDDGRLLLLSTSRPYAWQAGGWTPLRRDPGNFQEAAMAFDLANDEIVVFGGASNSNVTAQTWLWSGVWQLAAPPTTPPARQGAALAWHGADSVMFGGSAATTYFADTWLWNGADWQQAMPSTSPSPRTHAAMALDPSRGTVVLFGGRDGSSWLGDTWEWNGVTWNPIASTTAPPALQPSLAFDHMRQVLCLFLASGASAPGELWELSPSGWLRVSTSAPMGGDLVYDPAIAAPALFATIGASADYLGGVWVPRNQARAGQPLTDLSRGCVLNVNGEISRATFVPASTSVYGNGCGPAGLVTCSLDRMPAFDVSLSGHVRAGGGATPTFLVFGLTQAAVGIGGGCTIYIDNLLFDLAALAAPSGWAAFDLLIPSLPGTLGIDAFAQAVALQAGGLGFSNGVQLRIGH